MCRLRWSRAAPTARMVRSRPRSCRFRERILSDTFLGSPSAQPALVIALSERHTPRAQDVVCGDGVEIEVGQRKRKDEGLRREGYPPRADLKVQVLSPQASPF